jgi:hypothetical protein
MDISNLLFLQQIGRQINRRLLNVQRVSHNCHLSWESIEWVVLPTELPPTRLFRNYFDSYLDSHWQLLDSYPSLLFVGLDTGSRHPFRKTSLSIFLAASI